MPTRTNENQKEEQKECFVIMPISDVNGYPEGHFDLVYKNIIRPSCELAGYSPFRADEDRAANMIQLEILRKLLAAPLVICDLSTRNPNVLFELGIRQAFDKPVVLIQEEGTSPIFDIATIRYLEYKKEMQYQDVLATHEKLKQAILATTNPEKKGTNSIVSLLQLEKPATFPQQTQNDRKELGLEYILAEIRGVKNDMHKILNGNRTVRILSPQTREIFSNDDNLRLRELQMKFRYIKNMRGDKLKKLERLNNLKNEITNHIENLEEDNIECLKNSIMLRSMCNEYLNTLKNDE